jgi:diguanylate cyclase (GGDEF)-like protein/PAS domain S-box-containing protein
LNIIFNYTQANDGSKGHAVANDVFFREENFLRKAQHDLLIRQEGSAAQGIRAELVQEYARLFRHARRMAGMGDRMQRTLNDLNHRLAASEERYRGIFENVVEGIFRARGAAADAVLVEANPALDSMLGRTADMAPLAEGMRVGALFASPAEREGFAQRLAETGRVRGFPAEILRPDGTRFWAELSASILPEGGADAEGPGMVVVVADVTERRRMMEEIYRLARTDSLTGLWNRGYFMDMAQRELARVRRERQPASIIMVDADHFKRVNDTHGHQVGDEALRCLARVLSDSVREADLPARLGGEEFVVLLPGAERAAATAVAERIRSTIRETCLRCPSGDCFCLTVSLGVAISPCAQDSLEHLIRRADAALYAAKNAGRNRVELCEGAA